MFSDLLKFPQTLRFLKKSDRMQFLVTCKQVFKDHLISLSV